MRFLHMGIAYQIPENRKYVPIAFRYVDGPQESKVQANFKGGQENAKVASNKCTSDGAKN